MRAGLLNSANMKIRLLFLVSYKINGEKTREYYVVVPTCYDHDAL